MPRSTSPRPERLLLEVGLRIRAARETACISQQAFATAVGMKKQFASRIELGRQNLELRTLARIAEALSTTMSALLDGVEAKIEVDRSDTPTERPS